MIRGVKKGIRRIEGTRFRPRAGMIDRTRFRAIVSPRRDSHAKRADTRGWIPLIFS